MNITTDDIDKIFKSDDVSSQIEFLDGLVCEDYNPDLAAHLCSYLQKNDKGLRNALKYFFIQHKCYLVADKLTEFISSDDISLRNIAGEILLSYKTFAVDALIKYIRKTKDVINLKFAADILAQIQDKKVVQAALEFIDQTADENVLISYIEALGNNREISAVDKLIQMFNRSDTLKPFIIYALGKIGSNKALNFLLQEYKKGDDLLKFIIIESLGNIGNEDSFFFLISELQNASESVIPPILDAIHKLHIAYGFDIPFDDKMKRALIVLLNHKELEYKRLAVNLVSEYEDEEIIMETLKYYGLDAEYDEVIYSKLLMSKNIVIKQISQLLDLDRENLYSLLKLIEEIIYQFPDIIQELNQVELNKAIDSISRCLNHPDEMVRLTSLELIFNLVPESATLYLDDEILNENFWIKIRLVELLETLTDENSLKFLEKLSEDENEMVSNKAKEILATKKSLS